MRIEGPLAICQLLETTLLNLVNFASLVTTNATRMRLAAGDDKSMLEFGLRRAQGPDGGISASKYCIIGGFDGTSNVLAGKLFDLTVKGTHAHAYVMAHTCMESLHTRLIQSASGKEVDFVDLVLQKKAQLGDFPGANIGELAAFIEYSQAFPRGMLALVDTYDTLQSGVPNFICVAAALYELGYVPLGIRLDSGDLAYLSKETRKLFAHADKVFGFTDQFFKLNIVASNDLNEKVLASLVKEGHEINTFGIGTHLVTCHDQPALGCVYKLVEINGVPRIKLSQEVEKVVLPGSKSVYRIYGKDGTSILDLIQLHSEPAPFVGVPLLCRHPFQENKRAMVTPSRVEPLLNLVWNCGELPQGVPTLELSKQTCKQQISSIRSDHIRGVHPTPYKVSVSQHLYDFLHQLWHKEAPITTLD